ncbi:hypothetical protein PCANC_21072 [Puccinia coronata f. sp. avenae]|uniref:Uncharacterized protein n=1 Tax=Puccinia coronata f. sp. avenae TaxID=200324 RepID=A0A2N5TV41_9BASI|nr:hypothetical protein PCASD_17607 [Puccinia coronata f. sp. avenae]PLW31506.1 hypothetical protein PCANC_21072 [Puccinia coronata f. sp. avenae]
MEDYKERAIWFGQSMQYVARQPTRAGTEGYKSGELVKGGFVDGNNCKESAEWNAPAPINPLLPANHSCSVRVQVLDDNGDLRADLRRICGTAGRMPLNKQRRFAGDNFMRRGVYNKLGGGRREGVQRDKLAVADFRPPVTYYTTMPPPINQLDPHQEFVTAMSDPARLREICK